MTNIGKESKRLNATDTTPTIIELNYIIRQFNREQAHPEIQTHFAPTFHTWGLKSTKIPVTQNPRSLMETFSLHRAGEWREQRPVQQLHLSDEARLRMGRSCVKYFQKIYEEQ